LFGSKNCWDAAIETITLVLAATVDSQSIIRSRFCVLGSQTPFQNFPLEMPDNTTSDSTLFDRVNPPRWIWITLLGKIAVLQTKNKATDVTWFGCIGRKRMDDVVIALVPVPTGGDTAIDWGYITTCSRASMRRTPSFALKSEGRTNPSDTGIHIIKTVDDGTMLLEATVSKMAVPFHRAGLTNRSAESP
jgi:hypothetical protein